MYRSSILPATRSRRRPLVGCATRRGRHRIVETEALGQTFIVNLVREWLNSLLPEPIADVRERERIERAQMCRASTSCTEAGVIQLDFFRLVDPAVRPQL